MLTAGELAVLHDRPGSERDSVRFEVRRDPLLVPLANPLCPARSSLEVMSFVGTELVYGPRIELACDRWQPRGSGYLYRDPHGDAAPVRSIRYTDRHLSVRVRGMEVTPGPVAFVQMRLWIGEERFLIRAQSFRRNDASTLVSRRPRTEAAAGEAAFWATLGGDSSRSDEAIALLGEAAERRPTDGRSRFLLGMMHLYRFGGMIDWNDPSDAARAEVAAARDALQASEPLLWDGETGDNRVPGFVAAAVYQFGVAHGDAAEKARGLQLLDDAVALNPLFNSFDLFSAAPVLAHDDPVFQRIVELVDEAFSGSTAACVVTQPDFCANQGMAPHNLEGSLLLFGDIHAKAGRNADAARMYGLAAALGGASGWSHLPEAIARRDGVDERVMRFRNGDPGDDPPIFGASGAACVGCHGH